MVRKASAGLSGTGSDGGPVVDGGIPEQCGRGAGRLEPMRNPTGSYRDPWEQRRCVRCGPLVFAQKPLLSIVGCRPEVWGSGPRIGGNCSVSSMSRLVSSSMSGTDEERRRIGTLGPSDMNSAQQPLSSVRCGS